MVSGDNVEVTLTGGAPWGFRLTGGASLPLEIAKIRKKSQAHAQGLREGDAVVSINGTPVHDLSHDQAVELIEAAGDTLRLQIYRGDADDLGQVLASTKPLPTLAPLGRSANVTSSASSTATYDDGTTRGTVQQEFFVEKGEGLDRQTMVRKEHATTVSTSGTGGDVNGNEMVQLEVSTSSVSGNTSTSTSRTSSLQISSSSTVDMASSSVTSLEQKGQVVKQQVQQRQVQQQQEAKHVTPIPVPKGPTFKAVPPKTAPAVAPKPSRGPVVAPKPSFNATLPAPVAAPMFSPTKFQVSATAMYAPGAQSVYAPASPRPFSPGRKQQQQQPAYPPAKQPAYSPARPQPSPVSPASHPQQLFSPGGPQPFSPVSLASPVSPGTSLSQPFSPMSPGNTPMFNVRNNLGGGANVWTANMWLPGQEPSSKQQQQQQPQQQPRRQLSQQQQRQSEDVDVSPRLSIKERQQLLLQQTAKTNHSLGARQADPNFDAPSEEEQQRASAQRLKVFGPPVEMTPWGPEQHLGITRTDSVESGNSSPTSSLIRRKKKMYSDSAFYEDPLHKYPTIEEQMKLCRLISTSLTSAANKKARGAKMFARRKKRSTKWVHEAHSELSSSTGDVANLHELDSELSPDEGGVKPLFQFRIPNIKQRVASPERNTKMSMKKDEFERLRLQGTKCDHRAVSPGTCFDIVADLKASKGRGGRLFERRKNRADKFIVDESNARKMDPKGTKLEDLLNMPLKSSKTPWEAAQSDQQGKVDAAFDHLTDMERIQKLNQILKYTPPKPAPKPAPAKQDIMQPLTRPYDGPRADLRGHTLPMLEGRNFNRYAKGWNRGGDITSRERAPSVKAKQHMPPFPEPLSQGDTPRGSRVQFGDYNPRPKAWQAPTPGESYSCPASMSASWASSDFEAYHNGYRGSGFYSPDDHQLPACDL